MNIKFEVVNFINNRPLCLLSTLVGLKEFLFGLGFLLGLNEVRQTQLYANFDSLVPGVSGDVAGVVFILMGLFIASTAIIDKIKYTKIGLQVSAFFWLFCMFMYALNGSWLLAFGFAMFMSAVPGYISFYYKYAPLWAAQKKAFREKFELDAKQDHVLSSRHID